MRSLQVSPDRVEARPRHRLSKNRCVTSVKKLSHGRVWIKDGRGPDADWRTRTGGRGLADADWRTRTGGRGLRAFQPRILTRNVRIFKLKHI